MWLRSTCFIISKHIFYLKSNPLCLWRSWCSCNFPWPICLWKKHFFIFYISLHCSPSFWCCICSQKPYACQIPGCTKRYTDPSSLRKHVKAHSAKGLQEREVKVKAERVAHRAGHRVWHSYILVKKNKKQTHHILQGNTSRPVINTHTEFVGRFLVAPSCTKSNSSIFTKRQEEGRVSMFMIQ